MVEVIHIETLQSQDKEAVQRLLVDSYSEYSDSYSDPQHWLDYKQSLIDSVNNEHVDQILVAKAGDDVLGTLQIFLGSEAAYQRKELEIHDPVVRLVAVSPQARGKGIAQALLKESIAYARDKQAKALYLHTSDRMAQAIRLYERFGFVRDFSKEFSKFDILVKCYRYDL